MGGPTVSDIHVTPTGDAISHDDTPDCICGPDHIDETGGRIYVHHSLDGREIGEGE